MSDHLSLPGKWTFRCHGRTLVLVKRPNERAAHVFMKALLWGLYLPFYPDLEVEVEIGGRYKPDLVAGRPPRFWAEAGQVGVSKVEDLVHRYPNTHFVLAKWDVRLDPWAAILEKVLAKERRRAPVELIGFPADSEERFVDGRGNVHVNSEALQIRRFGPA